MLPHFANRRAPAVVGVIWLLASVPACHGPERRCPPSVGGEAAPYASRRPVYGTEPARTLNLGGYAGYNYGSARGRGTAIAPEPMVIAPEPAEIQMFGD